MIRALALGTLPQEARGALDTYFVNDIVNHGDKSPAVYAMFIDDEDGMPPTKADVIEILFTCPDCSELNVRSDFYIRVSNLIRTRFSKDRAVAYSPRASHSRDIPWESGWI